MKYTFEPYNEDGSPRKWVGSFRPQWDEVKDPKISCKFNCFTAISSIKQNCYKEGHYDSELYEDDSNEPEFEDGVGNKIVPSSQKTKTQTG